MPGNGHESVTCERHDTRPQRESERKREKYAETEEETLPHVKGGTRLSLRPA